MSKKLITTCMALVAFAALALPSGASAITLGHTSGGVFSKIAVPNTITGTNVGAADFTNAAGTVTLSSCSKVVVTGDLEKNGPAVIEGTITTATFSGEGAEFKGMKECTSETLGGLTPTTNGNNVDGENVENGTPWCLKSVEGTDEFTVRGNACTAASRPITFILHSTLAGECKYSRSTAIKGTFTTDETEGVDKEKDAVLSLVPGANTEFTKEAVGGGGVLCPGVGALRMSFTLETDKATVEPLYLKKGE